MDDQHIELLAQVASFYFEQNLRQEEIASRIGYSRSMVSRLLAEAREKNVVEVRINYPLHRCLDLEEALQQALNLRIVRVLSHSSLGKTQTVRKLGSMAARLVEQLVSQGAKKIGVAWGTALWEMISAMRNLNFTDSRVYQLIGSTCSHNPEIDGPNLSRQLAEALGGQYFTIPAPLIVDSPATREALMRDQSVARILAETNSIDLALVGTSAIDPETSIWIQSGYLSQEQVSTLASQGAVGEVCGIIFDRMGNRQDNPILNRVIGIEFDNLRRIPLRLCISAGENKTLPVLGACRAGLINCLVTDEDSALGVLADFRDDLRN